MTGVQTKRKGGRPPLAVSNKRKKITIRLSDIELAVLQKAHNDSPLPFSSFLRKRLLATNSIVIQKQLALPIRQEIQKLLSYLTDLHCFASEIPVHADQARTQDSIVNLQHVIKQVNYHISERVKLLSCMPAIIQLLEALETQHVRSAEILESKNQLKSLVNEYLQVTSSDVSL